MDLKYLAVMHHQGITEAELTDKANKYIRRIAEIKAALDKALNNKLPSVKNADGSWKPAYQAKLDAFTSDIEMYDEKVIEELADIIEEKEAAANKAKEESEAAKKKEEEEAAAAAAKQKQDEEEAAKNKKKEEPTKKKFTMSVGMFGFEE